MSPRLADTLDWSHDCSWNSIGTSFLAVRSQSLVESMIGGFNLAPFYSSLNSFPPATWSIDLLRLAHCRHPFGRYGTASEAAKLVGQRPHRGKHLAVKILVPKLALSLPAQIFFRSHVMLWGIDDNRGPCSFFWIMMRRNSPAKARN